MNNKTLVLAVHNALYTIISDINGIHQQKEPYYVQNAIREMGVFIEARLKEISVPRAMLGPLGPSERPAEEWDAAAKAAKFFPVWLLRDVVDILSTDDFLAAEYDGLTREDVADARRALITVLENSTDA